MRSNIFASTLAILLGIVSPVVSAIAFPEASIAQTLDQRKQEADRLFVQGIEQFEANQIEAALKFWHQSLFIYRAINDELGEGESLENIG
jgi:hypothetical protein